VDALVLAAVNSSLRVPIDAPTLSAVLRGEQPPGRWRMHLAAFFSDVPVFAAEQFAAGHGIPRERLRAALARVQDLVGEPGDELDDWLGRVEASAPAGDRMP